MNETNTFEELIVMRSKSGDGTIFRQTPLVRCKNCKKHGDNACPMVSDCVFETADNWYCADGERKEATE